MHMQLLCGAKGESNSMKVDDAWKYVVRLVASNCRMQVMPATRV